MTPRDTRTGCRQMRWRHRTAVIHRRCTMSPRLEAREQRALRGPLLQHRDWPRGRRTLPGMPALP